MKRQLLLWSRFGCIALIVGLVVGGATSGFCDIFELKDGRKLEGTILGEFGTLVSIKTKDGKVVTVEAEEIKKRTATSTAYDEYLERSKTLKDDDPTGQLEMARWCLEKNLLQESAAHFKRLLALDPNQPEARDALGYERVKGDWYLKGPDAERAKKGKPDPWAVPLKSVPDKVDTKKLTREWSKPRTNLGPSAPAGSPVIRLNLKETVNGKPPTVSGMAHLLRQFLVTMDKPMSLEVGGTTDAPYTMKIDLDVKFERTLLFYKKLPLYHIYKGVGVATLIDKATGKALLQMRFDVPFSASTKLEKDKAVTYAYHHTVMTVLYKFSKNGFFRSQGCKKRPDPNA